MSCAPASTADDPEIVPPVLGQDAIEAWFTAGHYLQWSCNSPQAAIAPSPHGRLRVCTNPIAVGNGADAIDASFVAELLDPAGAIVGRGAQRHTRPEMTGEAWYWYMRVPADSATEHDAGGLAADGWGFEGPPQTYCAACHQAGDDFVFGSP